MIRSEQCEHLTPAQRSRIRGSLRTNWALSLTYGVSVETILLVRATADRHHPAHVAAMERLRERVAGYGGYSLDLTVLGGPELPHPLS